MTGESEGEVQYLRHSCTLLYFVDECPLSALVRLSEEVKIISQSYFFLLIILIIILININKNIIIIFFLFFFYFSHSALFTPHGALFSQPAIQPRPGSGTRVGNSRMGIGWKDGSHLEVAVSKLSRQEEKDVDTVQICTYVRKYPVTVNRLS